VVWAVVWAVVWTSALLNSSWPTRGRLALFSYGPRSKDEGSVPKALPVRGGEDENCCIVLLF
jgi:hypothetical protein